MNNLNEKTVKELREMIKEMNIELVGAWKAKKEVLINAIEEHIESLQPAEETQPTKRTGKKVQIVLLNGEIKIFNSASEATRELNIKHKNAISGYWSKGKCKKAMNAAGISEVAYL